ncbi:MAG: DUF1292 domain-containing protein [Clostridiales bacterium]|nr:DUF1292 domain-containing protein [Clostridiales bacterium]HOC08427.1 DUF1292 domain-containing protein [Bacillota bacterium]HQA47562.1 DUF1292 domain-containing protein [Bacillota bacterium]HQD42054.1 DUF1292 domain-containing protein [Bacillota bacterium]
MEDDKDIVVLYDEEDNECRFEVLAVLDVDDGRYAILMPENEDEEEEEAYVLRIEQDENGEDILVGIDDDEELDTVVEAYEELARQQDN